MFCGVPAQFLGEVLIEDCCDGTGCTSEIRDEVNSLPPEDREEGIETLMGALRILKTSYAFKGGPTNVYIANFGTLSLVSGWLMLLPVALA